MFTRMRVCTSCDRKQDAVKQSNASVIKTAEVALSRRTRKHRERAVKDSSPKDREREQDVVKSSNASGLKNAEAVHE